MKVFTALILNQTNLTRDGIVSVLLLFEEIKMSSGTEKLESRTLILICIRIRYESATVCRVLALLDKKSYFGKEKC